MRTDNDDNFDPDFDALLAAARWPEPSPHATQRLRDRWHALAEQRPRRALRIEWLAAAAVIALAFGGTWFLLTQGGQVPTEVAQAPVVPPPPTVSSPPRPTPPPPPIVGLPPTPRERLAVLAALPVVDKAVVQRAIDLAVDGDEAAAITSLRASRVRAIERELMTTFASTTEHARRRVAIRLLSEVGDRSSLALLTRVAKDPKFAADAMPGVARLGGVEHLVILARSAPPAARTEAIDQLLAADSEPAVSEFLALVLDDVTRDDALASLHGAPAPPIGKLIAHLDDAHVDRRFAAAKALGTLCNRPEVGEALRRMVHTNRHRREAWAALLSCPSREATTFISTARTRASVDAEVRAVETELRRMF